MSASIDATVLIKEMSTPSSGRGRALMNERCFSSHRIWNDMICKTLVRERASCLQGIVLAVTHLTVSHCLYIVSLARPSSIWRVRYIAVLSPLPVTFNGGESVGAALDMGYWATATAAAAAALVSNTF